MKLVVDLPEGVTLGDITAAKGAVVEASTGYVDWEELYEGDARKAISGPGKVLLAIVHQLGDKHEGD
jgi:hypothetical protein